ncbi:hypothetical protein EYR40_009168 [Pleurotus pulmonarius]|nr:hypothetical protein EYR40_009168 [Pleurotus pulmonarius]
MHGHPAPYYQPPRMENRIIENYYNRGQPMSDLALHAAQYFRPRRMNALRIHSQYLHEQPASPSKRKAAEIVDNANSATVSTPSKKNAAEPGIPDTPPTKRAKLSLSQEWGTREPPTPTAGNSGTRQKAVHGQVPTVPMLATAPIALSQSTAAMLAKQASKPKPMILRRARPVNAQSDAAVDKSAARLAAANAPDEKSVIEDRKGEANALAPSETSMKDTSQVERDRQFTPALRARHRPDPKPFAHLPPALRPFRPTLAPPPALATPLPELNAAIRPSDTPRASSATQRTVSQDQDQQRAQIDALFSEVPRGLRPYRPTALKTPPPLPKGYISLSPSPPRSPISITSANPTPSLSPAPIHSEDGDEAKSSVGKGLLTLVSLTMWPVRNGAKPRTGVATRSQVLKAKGGVLHAAAAQLVIAQNGINVGNEVGSGRKGTKTKRTASGSVTAAAIENKDKNVNKKAQGTAKPKLMERRGEDEDDTSGDGQTMTHGAVAEPLPHTKSLRPAKRARLAAPHGSAKAPAKAMIRLPPRVTRASARIQATTDPSTSKAELDENESGLGGDDGEFQFIV